MGALRSTMLWASTNNWYKRISECFRVVRLLANKTASQMIVVKNNKGLHCNSIVNREDYLKILTTCVDELCRIETLMRSSSSIVSRILMWFVTGSYRAYLRIETEKKCAGPQDWAYCPYRVVLYESSEWYLLGPDHHRKVGIWSAITFSNWLGNHKRVGQSKSVIDSEHVF